MLVSRGGRNSADAELVRAAEEALLHPWPSVGAPVADVGADVVLRRVADRTPQQVVRGLATEFDLLDERDDAEVEPLRLVFLRRVEGILDEGIQACG